MVMALALALAHQERLLRDFSTTERVMLAELLVKLIRELREMSTESD